MRAWCVHTFWDSRLDSLQRIQMEYKANFHTTMSVYSVYECLREDLHKWQTYRVSINHRHTHAHTNTQTLLQILCVHRFNMELRRIFRNSTPYPTITVDRFMEIIPFWFGTYWHAVIVSAEIRQNSIHVFFLLVVYALVLRVFCQS